LRTGDLGIAEESFAIEQRRDFAGLSGSDQRSAEGDGQRDGQRLTNDLMYASKSERGSGKWEVGSEGWGKARLF